jgi:hypothetical protein
MNSLVYFIPILTALLSALFCVELILHWKKNPTKFFAWWIIGILFYGLGTVPEGLTAIFGWYEWVFKSWYILGAMIGGAPLAQGTIYLLMKRNPADFLSALLVPVILVGAIACALSPVDYAKVNPIKMSGDVLLWKEVRYFPIVINTYALLFFVGGAMYAAWSAWKNKLARNKCYGNLIIATGGLLPGIGGALMRYGHIEALYISEFFGIIIIYLGYKVFMK